MAQWIELMEPIAYGALGLTPWEFGSLTVTEFLKMVRLSVAAKQGDQPSVFEGDANH